MKLIHHNYLGFHLKSNSLYYKEDSTIFQVRLGDKKDFQIGQKGIKSLGKVLTRE